MERCPSPTLQWGMPHFSCCYKLSPLQGCWADTPVPAFSHWLYLQFEWRVTLPPPWISGCPSLFATCFYYFFSCLFIIQVFFSLFSLDGVQFVQEAMLIWPRVVCGSTAYCLAHLVVCFSQAG
jgi:hypothetical protein